MKKKKAFFFGFYADINFCPKITVPQLIHCSFVILLKSVVFTFLFLQWLSPHFMRCVRSLNKRVKGLEKSPGEKNQQEMKKEFRGLESKVGFAIVM